MEFTNFGPFLLGAFVCAVYGVALVEGNLKSKDEIEPMRAVFTFLLFLSLIYMAISAFFFQQQFVWAEAVHAFLLVPVAILVSKRGWKWIALFLAAATVVHTASVYNLLFINPI